MEKGPKTRFPTLANLNHETYKLNRGFRRFSDKNVSSLQSESRCGGRIWKQIYSLESILSRLQANSFAAPALIGHDCMQAEQRDMLVECCPYLDGVIARPAPSTLPSSVTAAATAKLSQEAGAADHDAATTALAAHDVVILDRPGVDDAGLTSTPDSNSSSSINPSSRDAVVDIVTMATPETRSDEEGFPRTGAGGDGVTDAARDHDNGDRRAIDKDADRQAVECDDTARTGCACASRPLIHVASASATNAASIISSGASSSAPTTSTIAAAANLTPAAPGTRGRPIPGDNEDQCGEETSDIPAPPLPASSFTPREAPTNVHGQGTAEVDGQVKKKKRKLGDPSYVETAARVQENLAADSVSPSPKKDKVDEEAAMERANKHMRGLMG